MCLDELHPQAFTFSDGDDLSLINFVDILQGFQAFIIVAGGRSTKVEGKIYMLRF